MFDSSERPEQLSSSQRLLLALKEARAKLEAVERSKSEPIAIIGMSCRFPGGADNLEAFWRLLRDGVDAITEVPPQRWDIDSYYDPDPDASGKIYTRFGGFLQQVDRFDPQFFGISPREAESLDPQQRLLLEVSWEALENAGVAAERLVGSRTGIFVGIGQNDYAQLHLNAGEPERINAYDGTGNGFCFASGRLSYVLGLHGPSMAVDTACSSSLVAAHLACQSLRAGECNLALVGGVQLILSPEVTIFLSRTHALSPDGRCKSFDASANGFGRGEGCGVLVLKRLSDAVADGDNILALIRGSAVNHDGSSSGLTVPNKLAQQTLIREALKNAKVEPSQVSYVEAHGTGTSLGDPIEIGALEAVLGKERSPEQPLAIGSVKTNIGHLEAAAGVAGLIKVVLALQHQEIPPHLHFKQPNPYINWDKLPVTVPTEPTPWLAECRIAGVSSFGMSGTNTHIVLEEAPRAEPVRGSVERPLQLLALSAKTEAALEQLVGKYENYLKINANLAIEDICFSANSGRSHFSHRLSVMADSTAELLEKLASFTSGQELPGVFSGEMRGSERPKIAFLFTGQGSQYIGMGRQLYETQPTFRQTLARCEEILRPYLNQPLLEVLYPEAGRASPLDETAYTQPALFALEYALFKLWESWGIKPDAVMGHSVGEYAAACVAGVFSLEDGLKLIAERGRLMQALPQNGEMVSLMADEALVKAAIQPYTHEVALAAINGPQSIVISGKRQAIRTICAALEAKGIKTKKLQVSHAFHSPLMEPMLADFERVAAEVSYSQPQIALISNVTGKLAAAEIATPQYWCRHVRQPVQFAASIETLGEQDCEILVEIGPKPVLLGMGRAILENSSLMQWLPSLRPGRSDWQQMLESLATLYVRGVPVDWTGFDRDYRPRRVVLPTYPFQRQRYWVETAKNGHGKTESLSQENIQTPIFNLLHQGETQQLAQYLETAVQLSAEETKFLPKLLEVLVKQHQQQLKIASLSDWLYEVTWQAQPLQERPISFSQPGSWLILADQGGLGQALANLLQERGQTCFIVYVGDSYQAKEPGFWSLNPSERDDFDRLVQAIRTVKEPSLRGIIHLWSLDSDSTLTNEIDVSSLEQVQTLGCGSALHLVQALVKENESVSPRMWLVTQGAVPVVPDLLPTVSQAPLWGLGKVLALEHPKLWGGMLDLSPDTDGNAAATLLAEIANYQGEDHVAFCSGQRYVARVVTKSLPQSREMQLKPDSTYLITGGLGALGLRVTRWLVERGARHLVLIGRRSPSAEVQEVLTSMEQAGTQILVARADVSSEEDMARVMAQMQTSMPPLRGIVHAAGVVGYQPMKDIDLDTFKSVLRPKVAGAWILHRLTQEMTLDFFVSFSSIASVWGSQGQAHYGAANYFLDTLTHYRRSLGLPATSVNWGPWSGGGMAVNEFQAFMTKMGVKAFEPEQGIAALEYLLGTDCGSVTVANVDWTLFKDIYEARGARSLLEKIEVQPRQEIAKETGQQSQILQQLAAAPVSERSSLLVSHLQAEVAEILKLESSQLPQPHQGFFDMGMDSLMAIELKKRLEDSFGASLPATLAFESPTIEALSEYFATEVLGWESAAEEEPAQSPQEGEQGASEPLSEEEIEASIAEKLAKLENLVRRN
jgi:malonyl CoA-acyl carrier protein transacylase